MGWCCLKVGFSAKNDFFCYTFSEFQGFSRRYFVLVFLTELMTGISWKNTIIIHLVITHLWHVGII